MEGPQGTLGHPGGHLIWLAVAGGSIGALAAAIIVIVLVLVAIVIYQRWRIEQITMKMFFTMFAAVGGATSGNRE